MDNLWLMPPSSMCRKSFYWSMMKGVHDQQPDLGLPIIAGGELMILLSGWRPIMGVQNRWIPQNRENRWGRWWDKQSTFFKQHCYGTLVPYFGTKLFFRSQLWPFKMGNTQKWDEMGGWSSIRSYRDWYRHRMECHCVGWMTISHIPCSLIMVHLSYCWLYTM